jgi:hypothetical protein
MTHLQTRRKVTPKVRDGIVQKKNRHVPTVSLGYIIDRESPARGCRHVVSKQDIRHFTRIIPYWRDLAVGLESIILTRASDDNDGRYEIFHREKTGSIQIPAWSGDLWRVVPRSYAEEHHEIFTLLQIATGPAVDGVECRFTLDQARAFLLLHVFLHELGHHVDRMESKAQSATRRGEPFAESYANRMAATLWPRYLRTFGDPRRERVRPGLKRPEARTPGTAA